MSRRPSIFSRVVVVVLGVAAQWTSDSAALAAPENSVGRAAFFESAVRPLLLDRCAKCHDGSAKAKSEFFLLSRESLMAGGEFGQAITPGRPDDSLLVQAVRWTHKELHMPPEEDGRLSAEEIGILSRWIAEGAYWPESDKALPPAKTAEPKQSEGGIAFDPETDWALLPRRVVAPPEVSNPRWAKNAIDRFVAAARKERRLSPAPRADRRSLVRRVTFDLTGLPPTPEEVATFLGDPSDDDAAFAKVVDRLLDSPAYGQRQGRLWLDVARYADTQGDVGDYPIPTAYLYRNWVIDSLNADLPFDEFIRAQIAGDVLAEGEPEETRARGLTAATGFISLSRRFGNAKKDSMHLTIEDTLDTIGRGIMGLTLRCARCHDHKFDPVSSGDYYALYGIFESTIYPWMGMSVEKSPSDLSPAIPDPAARKKIEAHLGLIERYEYQINNHFRPWLKPTLSDYEKVCGQMEQATAEAELAALRKQRDQLLEFRGGKFRELMEHGLQWVKEEKTRVAKDPGVEMIFAVGEGDPRDAKRHKRGNPGNLGEVVPRGFVATIDGPEHREIAGDSSGRLELARWLTDPAHPLTARVAVNRVWQQHFGRGLVATPDNFGRQGERPTHPELLDWLAEQFVAGGWSLKKLHRLMLNTETFRLSSAGCDLETNADVDPGNRYLWKFSRRRLDAESIRDGMMAVSGRLDPTQPDRHDIPPWYGKRYGLNGPFHEEIETRHRSVYQLTQRIYRHSKLGLFDAPDRNSSTAQRTSSHVPGQALFLMNSDFAKTQAAALAERVEKEAGAPDEARVDRLFQLLYSRDPDPTERESIRGFLQSYRGSNPLQSNSEWVALCRTLLNSNEFFFVE